MSSGEEDECRASALMPTGYCVLMKSVASSVPVALCFTEVTAGS